MFKSVARSQYSYHFCHVMTLIIISSATSASSDTSDTPHAANPSEIRKHEAYVSPINGFSIPPSPATRQLDIKCFTYNEKNPKGTTSGENIIKKDNAAEQKNVVTKILSADSEDEEAPKVVHLLGYCLSSASSSTGGVEYCATVGSSEDV